MRDISVGIYIKLGIAYLAISFILNHQSEDLSTYLEDDSNSTRIAKLISSESYSSMLGLSNKYLSDFGEPNFYNLECSEKLEIALNWELDDSTFNCITSGNGPVIAIYFSRQLKQFALTALLLGLTSM